MVDFELTNPWTEIPKTMLLINQTGQMIVGLVLLLLTLLFLRRYIQNRSNIVLILFFAYVSLGIGVFLGGFQGFLGWLEYDNQPPHYLAVGIPLLLIDAYLPLNSMAYVSVVVFDILLFWFIVLAFNRPSIKWLRVYSVVSIIWIVGALYYSIFIYGLERQYPADQSSVGVLGQVLFLVLGFVTFSLLIYVPYSLVGEAPTIVTKRGFQIIAVGGSIQLLVLLFFLIDGILMLNLTFIVWFLAIIALIFVYLGYIMPEWLVRRIESKTDLS